MDAVIRFCFKNIEPEEIKDEDEYAKIFSQARYILDYNNCAITNKAINSL